MTTVYFLADVECPWCGCHMERTIAALFYGGGTAQTNEYRCHACGNDLTIEATVDVAVRRAE